MSQHGYKIIGHLPHDCVRDTLPGFMTADRFDSMRTGDIIRCSECGTHWVVRDARFKEYRKAKHSELQRLLDQGTP